MRSPSRIRVALLGCGQIADAHLAQIQRIRTAEIAAVCDVHEDLAYQAAARFGVRRMDTSLERMLEEVRPDVVHITTPAHTHAPLTIQVLEAGCHAYVEKPFTLGADEACRVLEAAEKTGKLVCVGHDQLFDPCWLKCKDWIRQGLLGDVRRIDSVLGYPLDGNFGALVAANPRHWVRSLPGGLFQNIISHPLYRITDLLLDEQPDLMGGWRTRGEFDFPTEMDIALYGREQSGSLSVSTLLPPQRITRVSGTKGTVEIDFDAQTLRWSGKTVLPGALGRLEAPWRQFGNSCWNLSHNLWRFARSDIHYFAGMKALFEQFYAAIQHGAPLPIPSGEALRVTRLMDRIFDHCRQQGPQHAMRDPLTPDRRARANENCHQHTCDREAMACR